MESRVQASPTIKRWHIVDHVRRKLLFSYSKNHLFLCIVIVAAYCAGTKIGFLFTVGAEPISTLWPPNAILMASLLLMPTALWPFILLLIFPAHLLMQLSDGVSLYMSFCWFMTNITEALIGAAAIRRYTQSVAFEKLRDTSLFLIFGVVVAPFFTSFLDIGAVMLLGVGGGDFWRLWLNRLLTKSVAAMVLVPAIIAVVQQKLFDTTAGALSRKIEAVALTICLAAVISAGFVIGDLSHIHHYATLFSLFHLMIWSVIRFQPGFFAQVNLAVVIFAIWGAHHWQGPFTVGSVLENVLAIQFFILFAGAPLLLLAAVIAEWKEAETSAINRKQQLSLALEAGGMVTWSWDQKSDRVQWNGASVGDGATYPYTSTTKMASNKYVHPDDQRKHSETLEAAVASGSSFESEVRLLRENGEYRWFSVRGCVFKDAQSKSSKILGISTDIDRQKKEAVKIQRQRDELAHLGRVAMLGEISGTIAHELNQPLTAILSNAQAARRIYQEQFPEPTPISEILNDIISENKRAGEIIQRMRDLLKKGEVNPRPIDINAVIPKVIALENSDLIARNVVVKIYLQTGLPAVVADSIQVQQVLLNLIINACDAMQHVDPSRRHIRIATTWHDDATLRVSVSDQGHGVAENKLESIFEPFVTSKAHGLGLGLALCRSIIEAHGGWLWAKNNREGGATFSFTLPVATASEH